MGYAWEAALSWEMGDGEGEWDWSWEALCCGNALCRGCCAASRKAPAAKGMSERASEPVETMLPQARSGRPETLQALPTDP